MLTPTLTCYTSFYTRYVSVSVGLVSRELDPQWDWCIPISDIWIILNDLMYYVWNFVSKIVKDSLLCKPKVRNICLVFIHKSRLITLNWINDDLLLLNFYLTNVKWIEIFVWMKHSNEEWRIFDWENRWFDFWLMWN
jgi:hypothetical protein